MPVVLPPVSRRRFLFRSAAAVGASLLPRWLHAAEIPIDPHRIALLSDIHLSGNPDFVHKSGVNPYQSFLQAREEILALRPRPSVALVNGDCACLLGLPEDYAIVREAVHPIREAGIPLYLAMGNHDQRESFWTAFPSDQSRLPEMTDRQISVFSTPRANFFMLDSLIDTNKTPGFLGDDQLKWLARELDAKRDKPALVFVHHQPDFRPKIAGLIDTRAIYDVILPRKQVKALVFGHTHDWNSFVEEGVHCVNLPATAWNFKPGQPRGWVDLTLGENGATFELRSLDPTHPEHGDVVEAKWRPG